MTKIALPYDPEWRALKWAMDNCPSYITNMATENSKIVYYFSDENESLMFLLAWSGRIK